MADEQLTAELDLSIEAALASVDTLTTTLTASLDDSASNFADSLSTAVDSVGVINVPVEADASAIPAEIEDTAASVGVTVPVDADTSVAAEDINALEGEAPPITVEVDADTSQAQSAMDDLGSSASGASTGLEQAAGSSSHLGETAGVLGGAVGLATGNVKGLTGELGASSAGMGAVVGIGGAVAGTFGEIAQKGVEATGAQQRFNSTLGDQARAMETIHVGNLTIGFDELGQKLGTTTAEMQNTTSSMFQFATNSGASADQATHFSQEILALSARAVALRPDLGSVADVADTLATKISRGGKFITAFGISLTAAQINSQAMDDTNKTTAADLTVYEKSVAAAELATGKYGGTLKQTVEEGSKNAIIQERNLKVAFDEALVSIGKPLVAPMFDAIKASLPIFVSFASAVAEVGVSALPILTTALQAAAPPLQLLADALSLAQPILPAITLGFLAAGAAIFVLPGALTLAATGFDVLGLSAVSAGVDVAAASVAMEATPIGLIVGGLALAATAFGLFGSSTATADANLSSFTDAVVSANGALSESAVNAASKLIQQRNQADDLAGAHLKLKDVLLATDAANKSQTGTLEQIAALTKDLSIADGNEATSADLTGRTIADNTAKRKELIATLREQNPALASVVSALLSENGTNFGVINTLHDLAKGHGDAAAAARDNAKAGLDQGSAAGTAAAANKANADASAAAAAIQKDQNAAYSGGVTALQQYAAGQLSASDATKALSGASAELKANMDLLLGNYVSQQQASITYLNDLQKQNDGLVATGFNLNAFTQAGRDNQSALLASTSAAESYGQAILNSGGSVAQAIAPLQSFRDGLANIQGAMKAAGADTSFVDGLLANVDGAIAGMKAKTPEAGAAGAGLTGAASDGVAGGAGAAAGAGTTVGGAATAGFGAGLAPMPGVASSSVLNSVNAAALQGANAHNIGYGIGAKFSEGIGDGIDANTGYIQAKARQAVAAAKAAADGAAKSSSPSRLFMEVGANMAAGMALGIAAGTPDVAKAMAGLVVPPPTGPSGAVTLSQSSIERLAQAITVRPSGGAQQGGVVIQNATFGTQDVLGDLDWFARTRMAGV